MDVNKLREKFDSVLSSISDEEFKEWNDFDNAEVMSETFYEIFEGNSINATVEYIVSNPVELCGISTTENEVFQTTGHYKLAA